MRGGGGGGGVNVHRSSGCKMSARKLSKIMYKWDYGASLSLYLCSSYNSQHIMRMTWIGSKIILFIFVGN